MQPNRAATLNLFSYDKNANFLNVYAKKFQYSVLAV